MPERPLPELWQTEWCPASHRVRQRLTELGLDVVSRVVPVERAERNELIEATGGDTIPVLVVRGRVIRGEEAIIDYLNYRFSDSPAACAHREKAAMARRRELEEACRQLAVPTR